MSQYRMGAMASPLLDEVLAMIAEQDDVPVGEVRVKQDPHPHAPDDEIVICTDDSIDHWPDAPKGDARA